jgi:hypothetical protein
MAEERPRGGSDLVQTCEVYGQKSVNGSIELHKERKAIVLCSVSFQEVWRKSTRCETWSMETILIPESTRSQTDDERRTSAALACIAREVALCIALFSRYRFSEIFKYERTSLYRRS